MGLLLEQGAVPEPRNLRRGEVVEGVVMGVVRDGLLIDLVEIGSKSEGIVPSNEMHSLGAEPTSRVKAGDKVLATVNLRPSKRGRRYKNSAEGVRVLDGPFTESKELIAGYVMVTAASIDEASKWIPDYMAVVGTNEVDVREVE